MTYANKRKPHEIRASSIALPVIILMAFVLKTGSRSFATAVMNKQGLSFEIVSLTPHSIFPVTREETCKTRGHRPLDGRGPQPASLRLAAHRSGRAMA